ncbi:MAG: nucleotidyltransferase domain-containing protein [Sulfuricella sp.]|nr:nucleotidyltransferase domain-containing protein [Sulfuricella sp.]
MVLDLSPEQLRIAREILQRRVPDLPVWAFGSRVTGKARKYSDLDLAVGGEEPLPLAVLAELEHDFSESDLVFRVDIVDWASAGEEFKAAVAGELYRL